MDLEQFLGLSFLSFILVFARIGTTIMIMPSIGDAFVATRVRLLIAVSMSFVFAPFVYPYLPHPVPDLMVIAMLTISEFITGLLIGTVTRILMTSLDTAGMIISNASGLGSAQVFNPSYSTQGSIMGTLLSVCGMVLFMVFNFHHLVFIGLANSYQFFPIGEFPDGGSMANIITIMVSSAFRTGIQMSAPFLILSLMMYVGMRVLSRLMPQIQVFMLAIPLQILLSISAFAMACSALFLFWASEYKSGIEFFFASAGG